MCYVQRSTYRGHIGPGAIFGVAEGAKMVQRFQGPAPPVGREEPTYQVLRVQKHGPLDLTICAETIRSVTTHWVVGDVSGIAESVLCTHWEDDCPHHGERMEWAGFLPVYDHQQQKKAVLRLSPKEADAMTAVLGVDVAWHGQRVRLAPVNSGQGKRAVVTRPDTQAGAVRLKTWDVGPTICAVFRVQRIPAQGPRREDPDAEIPLQ